MKNIKLVISVAMLLWLCASCASIPKNLVEQESGAPDYSQLSYWAAHPDKDDPADLIPKGLSSTPQEELSADVFFVHPTIYTGKPKEGQWNASLSDTKLNKKIDDGTIQYQASAFNQAGKVYAPRYRQAHLSAYYEADSTTATRVFELAYQDVKNAFQYYLDHHRQGRPFIIASHSQGTTHTTRLIKEMIDEHDLAKDLIAAYLVGMPVPKSMYTSLGPCQSANDTGCLISWRTYKTGFVPDKERLAKDLILQNPISWTTDDVLAGKEKHQGAILRNFDKVLTQATDAQVLPGLGILWASKPKFPGSFLFTTNNYHIADINFYYVDVRENSKARAEAYHKTSSAPMKVSSEER